MNNDIANWTWHKYTEPAAGWDGYLEDDDGNVRVWVATDGELVRHEDIQGHDDDDENLPPYGTLSWLLD